MTRGPSPDELARVFLDIQAGQWVPLIADHTDEELDEIGDVSVQPLGQPQAVAARIAPFDLTLQPPLPRLLPPRSQVDPPGHRRRGS